MVESKPSHFDEIKGKNCMVMKRVSNYNKLERLFSGISLFLTTTMITSSRDSCSSGSRKSQSLHRYRGGQRPQCAGAQDTVVVTVILTGHLCHSAIYMVARTRERSELTFCTQHPIFLCFDQLGSHDNIQIICFDKYVRLMNDYLREKVWSYSYEVLFPRRTT